MNFSLHAQNQYERFSSERMHSIIERKGGTRIGTIVIVVDGVFEIGYAVILNELQRILIGNGQDHRGSGENYVVPKLLHAKPMSRIFTFSSPFKSMFGSQFGLEDVVPNFLQTVSGSLIGQFFRIIQMVPLP